MSRSIHTTKRELVRAHRRTFDRDETAADLDVKRHAKWGTYVTRVAPDLTSLASSPPTFPPIRVFDGGPSLHYPATPDDLRGVLRLLPAGIADGVNGIELDAGCDSELVEDGPSAYREPFTGRLRSLTLDGVYNSPTLGTYDAATGIIRIAGYIYDPARPTLDVLEPYLRLRMLATFVHELAHHHDHRQRTARGRWVAKNTEAYAEENEREWLQAYVAPYLEEARPESTERLLAFVRRHGGIDLPLASLAIYEKKYGVHASIPGAFESLLEAVEAGEDLVLARMYFASELSYADELEAALAIAQGILVETPTHAQTRRLAAELFIRLVRYDEAEALLRTELAHHDGAEAGAEERDETWALLAQIHQGRGAWREAEAAWTRALACAVEQEVVSNVSRALFGRAFARAELGDEAGFAADVSDLELAVKTRGRERQRMPGELRALYALRRLRWREAIQICTSVDAEFSQDVAGGQEHTSRVLEAVRFEAARALGLPPASYPLTTHALQFLRPRGHGQWMDRLASLRDAGSAK